jgi:hypothetical protein|tara:strand:- start:2951 stop:3259 length:309 start_codon:yes stop_codon:yes gene_type:complete
MNDMRKIMESILLETPLQVGDIVGYKNKSYEVVGINPNDWDQVLIKSQTSDAEGWVDDSKLSRNPPVAETVEEIEEVVESDDIDIDTFLENLEISIKNIISK